VPGFFVNKKKLPAGTKKDDPLRDIVGEVAMIGLYIQLVLKPFVAELLADPTISIHGKKALALIVDGGDGIR